MINEMIWLDWALLAVLLGFTVIGFVRGALSNNLPLFIVVLALFLSISFKDFFGDWSREYFNNEVIPDIIGYVISFIVILIVAKIIKVIFKSMIEATGLGVIDHPLGGILSLVKTSIVLVFLLALAELSELSNSIAYRQSQVIDAIQPQISWAIGHLPNSLSDLVNKNVAKDFDSQRAQVYDAIREKSSDIKDGTLKQIDRVTK